MSQTEPVRVLASRSAARGIARELSRRKFLGLGAMAGTAALLAACGNKSDTASAAPTGGKLEDSLSLYSWGDYDDPSLYKKFTKEDGPKMTVDSFGSNEELISKLTAAKGTSGYDVIVPTGVYIPSMVHNKLLMKMNKDLIPNLKDMDPAFLGRDWDPNNDYSICKAWGTTGFVYDNTKITRELKDWNDFFDAAQKEASGKVSVLDDPLDVTGMYFWANGIDWNTTDQSQIDDCEKFLLANLAPHVAAFNSYPGSDGSIPQGVYSLMQIWNGDARQGILASKEADQAKWQWVLPPATELWMDNWAISASAPHPEAAHAFINFILEPDNQLINTDYIGYNTGAKDIEAKAKAEGMDRLDLVYFTADQLKVMHDGALNEGEEPKVAVYNKVKAAAGA